VNNQKILIIDDERDTLAPAKICIGAAAAPGAVEGIAHVIFAAEELSQVQPGEILVAPITMAALTTLFAIVKGVVTDRGGVMANAVIVAREHGIPAVVGCRDATRKIGTGERIRVDGDRGRVDVLK
jgi:phosphoenolpyruvate synthase/pyruvate phosphate dikinase